MAMERRDWLARGAGAACCLVFALTLAELLPLPDGLPRSLGRPVVALLLSGLSGAGLFNPRLSPRLLPYLSSGYALLAAAALALSVMAPDHGLLARYHAAAGFAGPVQASGDAPKSVRQAGATRLDEALRFSGVRFAGGDRPFPLHFLDSLQARPDVAEDRERLPFSAVWEGVLHDRDATALVLEWRPGDAAFLRVGDRETGGSEGRAEIGLAGGGPAALRLAYDAAEAREARLRLSWMRDGRLEPVPAAALTPSEDQGLALEQGTAGRIALGLCAGFAAFCLAAGRDLLCWRPGLLFLLALALGMARLASLFLLEGQAVILDSAGSGDFLRLAWAREILLSLADPGPASFRVLPRYAAALVQGLLGEGAQSVAALDLLCLALSAALACGLAGRLCRDEASASGAGLIAFACVAFNPVLLGRVGSGDVLLAGLLFTALTVAALVAARSGGAAVCGLAGLLLGLACLTRGSALPLFGLLPAFLCANLGWRRGLRASLPLAAFGLAVLAPAAARLHLGEGFGPFLSGLASAVRLGNLPAEALPSADKGDLRAVREFIAAHGDDWLQIVWLKTRAVAFGGMGGWTAAFFLACLAAARRLHQGRALALYLVAAAPYAAALVLFPSDEALLPVLPLLCCVLAVALDMLLARVGWRLPLVRRRYPRPSAPPAPTPAEPAAPGADETSPSAVALGTRVARSEEGG